MGEVLFLAHRIPFPPDRGDKIRSHHVLKAIARLAPVHVASFADDEADAVAEQELAAVASSHCVVRRKKPLALAGIEAVASGRPISVTAFHDRTLAEWVDQLVAARPISVIYVFSGQMGQYVPPSFKGRVVADFVDVDSAKFEAYAAASPWPMRWVNAREGRKLRDFETSLAARADCSLFISAEEAALFRSRLGAPADVCVLANGIDSHAFDPLAAEPEPRLAAIDGPRLIFTGQMDYAPNIEAALRVIDRILPRVRRSIPGTSFHIVGRNPAAALLARNGAGGVHVWGRVDDIRSWLRAADLAILPLQIARGVQNKVLEAMAMALPVVLTPGAATGIGAIDREQLRIAESDDALAAAILGLLADPVAAKAMGAAARRFVIQRMSWDAALKPLPEILGLSSNTVRDAA
jgi:polysaccharide biosynthesis protein PslH